MSDSGDPKQDKQRELEGEREHAQGSDSESTAGRTEDPASASPLKAEIEAILHLFDNVTYAYPDPNMRTPATRIVFKHPHPAFKEASEALTDLFKEYVEGIIGEDEALPKPMKQDWKSYVIAQNDLRKEQRERLNQLGDPAKPVDA